MEILLVGLNHKTAPVETRECLAFSARELTSALPKVFDINGLREAVIVSTCNRTEIYVVAPSVSRIKPSLIRFLGDIKHIDPADFSHFLYYDRGAGLVRHLLRVTAGLDSMVLGETEILGQVRDAYRAAQEHGTVGKVLHELFSTALRVGKRAHTETEISTNAVSVSYAAVELARKVFDRLEGRRVLVIGAGQMSQLTAKHLQANGVKDIVVANRTVERARELADAYRGRAIAMADLVTVLPDIDVVISSTGAPHPIIDRERVQSILRARRGRPLFLVDIAVPRDIEPAVGQLDGVFLYDIDDLEAVVQSNLKAREREARRVEEIVEEEAATFERWSQAQEVTPIIRSLRQKGEAIRRREVEKALSMLPDLSSKERKVIDRLTSSIVNKLLNDPTVRLRQSASGASGPALGEAASILFNLQADEQGQEPERSAEKEQATVEFREGRPRLAFQDRAD